MKDLREILPERRNLTAGQFIKSFRIAYKITQKELADALGIRQSKLSSIENGKSQLSVNDAAAFSVYTGFSLEMVIFPNGIENDFSDFKKIQKKRDRYLLRRNKDSL